MRSTEARPTNEASYETQLSTTSDQGVDQGARSRQVVYGAERTSAPYFFFFQPPGLPEVLVRARRWRFFRNFLRDARPAYTPEDIDRYVEAWSRPGAAAAMINYYRASVRQSPKRAEAQLRPISAPALVIWGSAIATSAPN